MMIVNSLGCVGRGGKGTTMHIHQGTGPTKKLPKFASPRKESILDAVRSMHLSVSPWHLYEEKKSEAKKRVK